MVVVTADRPADDPLTLPDNKLPELMRTGLAARWLNTQITGLNVDDRYIRRLAEGGSLRLVLPPRPATETGKRPHPGWVWVAVHGDDGLIALRDYLRQQLDRPPDAAAEGDAE